MDDRRRWMGSQLPHQRWCRGRGAQTRRSALRWRFHYTRHRRTSFSFCLSVAVLQGQVECIGHSTCMLRPCRCLNVEWIVCGYLQGTFCGSNLPNGLHRFPKFDVPLFTPTTKADVGQEERMTPSVVEPERAKQACSWTHPDRHEV